LAGYAERHTKQWMEEFGFINVAEKYKFPIVT